MFETDSCLEWHAGARGLADLDRDHELLCWLRHEKRPRRKVLETDEAAHRGQGGLGGLAINRGLGRLLRASGWRQRQFRGNLGVPFCVSEALISGLPPRPTRRGFFFLGAGYPLTVR